MVDGRTLLSLRVLIFNQRPTVNPIMFLALTNVFDWRLAKVRVHDSLFASSGGADCGACFGCWDSRVKQREASFTNVSVTENQLLAHVNVR